jgi:hypothetical protein
LIDPERGDIDGVAFFQEPDEAIVHSAIIDAMDQDIRTGQDGSASHFELGGMHGDAYPRAMSFFDGGPHPAALFRKRPACLGDPPELDEIRALRQHPPHRGTRLGRGTHLEDRRVRDAQFRRHMA